MNRTPSFTNPASIPTAELLRYVSLWLMDGELSGHSTRTIEIRRMVFDKLAWFLADREIEELTTEALRAFVHYISTGHRSDPRGRWGNPSLKKPASTGTLRTYVCHLRTFTAWMVKQEYLAEDLMRKIPPVVDRPDEIQPFTPQQVVALLEAAKASPKEGPRNYALLLLLADTAARISEVLNLQWQDVDLSARQITVLGKGNRKRVLPFSATTGKALYAYVRLDGRNPEDYVFQSERGGPLTRNAIRLMFNRWRQRANIQGVRCSAHTVRHFAATAFLRNGGQAFSLQRMLGHTTLAMTRRYTAVVDADLAHQHRQASPVENLLRRKTR